MLMQELSAAAAASSPPGVRLGLDIVHISRIEESLQQFGEAFEHRLFTPGELAYAHAGTGVAAQRLAARFAAKEAVIKALQLSEAGVDWRDIEVERRPDGDCTARLHGRVRAAAAGNGVVRILLSLSHDGDYAGAVATVFFSSPSLADNLTPPLLS